ncbi:hypothetical protein FISHEDRAFT_73915 [Fistulina hepatica ATCC 64428]|uniref:Uncharacterized protein n=1 Tax=Fistulina hepatica ATCC 64428 TaxID=1128425 RepID=A0A0D7AE60_9AGAR|nr:hypothetical protein FISHEDRAFT_73915 [Fistulina hepatica ATCC 64428]
MAQFKDRETSWILLPEYVTTKAILEWSRYNVRCTSVSARKPMDQMLCAPYHDYIFYPPLTQPTIFCTYDDGTCEEFTYPYSNFPLVRSSLSPLLVMLSMQWRLIFYDRPKIIDQFCAAFIILDFWTGRIPPKFYWGPMRLSLQHPGSVADSFCVTESDAASVATRPCSVRASTLGDISASTDVAAELDVPRILAWLEDVYAWGGEALSELEAPLVPSDDADKWRTFEPYLYGHRYFLPVDSSRYTSNDWAYQRFHVSLWLPDGEKSCRNPQPECLPSPMKQVPRPVSPQPAGSVVSITCSTAPAADCAMIFAPLDSESMHDRLLTPRSFTPRSPTPTPTPCSETLLDAVGASPSAEKENEVPSPLLGVACRGEKRSRDSQDMSFERPLKRAHCHQSCAPC